jgi:hypothetical protein
MLWVTSNGTETTVETELAHIPEDNIDEYDMKPPPVIVGSRSSGRCNKTSVPPARMPQLTLAQIIPFSTL